MFKVGDKVKVNSRNGTSIIPHEDICTIVSLVHRERDQGRGNIYVTSDKLKNGEYRSVFNHFGVKGYYFYLSQLYKVKEMPKIEKEEDYYRWLAERNQ